MTLADSYAFARSHGASMDVAFKYALTRKTKQLLQRLGATQ